MMLLAQAGLAGTIGMYVIIAIAIAGIIGIAIIVARAAGVAIPAWFLQVLWVILAVAVGILAVKIILSML